MEPILVVSTLVLIFAPVHFYLRQEDLVTLRQWIGWGTSLEDCQEDPVTKEFRVEEETPDSTSLLVLFLFPSSASVFQASWIFKLLRKPAWSCSKAGGFERPVVSPARSLT